MTSKSQNSRTEVTRCCIIDPVGDIGHHTLSRRVLDTLFAMEVIDPPLHWILQNLQKILQVKFVGFTAFV